MRKISVLLFLLITVYMSFDCFSKGQNNFDSNKESFKDKYIGDIDYNKYPFLKTDLKDDEKIKNDKYVGTSDSVYGKNGFIYHITGVEDKILKNEKFVPDEWYKMAVDKMVELDELAKSQGKEVYFLLLPWKDLVYEENLPDEYKVKYNDESDMDRYYKYVKENSKVKFFYPLNELKEAKKYLRTYYTIDSHWNKPSGFLMTQILYNEMGMNIKKLSDCDYTIDEASSYGKYDYIIDYNGKAELIEEKIHGVDRPNSNTIEAKSDSNNDKTITIIGDSFRFWIYDVLKYDFKNTNAINRGTLGGNIQPTIIKNSDVIIIETVTDYYYDIIKTIMNVINMLK